MKPITIILRGPNGEEVGRVSFTPNANTTKSQIDEALRLVGAEAK